MQTYVAWIHSKDQDKSLMVKLKVQARVMHRTESTLFIKPRHSLLAGVLLDSHSCSITSDKFLHTLVANLSHLTHAYTNMLSGTSTTYLTCCSMKVVATYMHTPTNKLLCKPIPYILRCKTHQTRYKVADSNTYHSDRAEQGIWETWYIGHQTIIILWQRIIGKNDSYAWEMIDWIQTREMHWLPCSGWRHQKPDTQPWRWSLAPLTALNTRRETCSVWDLCYSHQLVNEKRGKMEYFTIAFTLEHRNNEERKITIRIPPVAYGQWSSTLCYIFCTLKPNKCTWLCILPAWSQQEMLPQTHWFTLYIIVIVM